MTREQLLAMEPFQRYIHFKTNPWLFLIHAVYTQDAVDAKTPIKLFPDKEYLELFCWCWQKYPLLAVPKTRRMTMSWVTISLYVWDTIFHQGRFNGFVSKKEDDANELVLRAKFILDNIKEEMIPRELIPEYNSKFNVLDFPSIKSKIQGFPQGADQLRQFTFSGIFGDESAFWDQAQEFYSASFPTIDGGGRMTLVSSPAPGFFKRLCFDAMDLKTDINVADYVPDYATPMEGVRTWQNKKNKFFVFELHYTADPTKRHPGYAKSVRESMPEMEYLREYELHWDTFSGFPVFPEFNKKLHKTREKMEPVPGLPMLIAFDFGLTPAALIAQYEGERLRIFREYIELNMGIERFMEKVVADLRVIYPTFTDYKKWRCFIDPAGFQKVQTDERSCAMVLGKFFNPQPGAPMNNEWEARRQAVLHFLRGMTKDGPMLEVSEQYCPTLIKGFEGGYRFTDKQAEVEQTKLRPLKDSYSHVHDANQYLCWGARNMVETIRRQIPRPIYQSAMREEPKQKGQMQWQRR